MRAHRTLEREMDRPAINTRDQGARDRRGRKRRKGKKIYTRTGPFIPLISRSVNEVCFPTMSSRASVETVETQI